MQKSELYLNEIRDSIRKIENSLKKVNKEEFKKDQDIIDMTLMRIQVIGENIKKIPQKIKKQHKEVDWKKSQIMRNVISHKYSNVDLDIIWDIIQNEIPKLKEALKNE